MCALLSKDKKARVLFIGNSYTYYNDMPKIFESIARAQGADLEVLSVTKGGYTLEQLASPDNEYGRAVDSLLSGERFDVVFLQEQSRRPVIDPELFMKGTEALTKKARANRAGVILYQTWGRNKGNPELYDIARDTREMAEKLGASYLRVAGALGCSLSRVGDAFLDVFENHPEVELYAPDGSHPNPTGSYLAALCHYAVSYGEDPTLVSYDHGEGEETARILKEAAKAVSL